MTDSSISIAGTTITIIATHVVGHSSVICNSVDTLRIGKLNSGTYELIYQIKMDNSPDIRDSDTIVFNVQNPYGVKTYVHSQQEINIFPNPTSTSITIVTPTKGSLSVLNMSGQQLLQQAISEPITTIDISSLPSGVYFVRVTGERTVQMGKVVKQ